MYTHVHAHLQWMMLSLINPPFTSRGTTDSPDRALSSPLRSLSAAGAHRPSPKFIANASVRLSPFPSPIAGDMGSAFTPATRPLGGAFTPYKRPILKRPAKSPVMKWKTKVVQSHRSRFSHSQIPFWYCVITMWECTIVALYPGSAVCPPVYEAATVANM